MGGMMAAQRTLIYHITHLGNLPRIIAAGGLSCLRALAHQGVGYTNIAHGNIQDRRATIQVPCGPGGDLHDYVPFYFAPRSPMLYVLNQGGVEGYREGQRPIIHLVSSVDAVVNAGLGWAFTDGHATMGLTDFFDDPADLKHVDWNVMRTQYWADTNEDPDRCRRRQAEFLVYQSFPWLLVLEIGVINRTVKEQVEAVLGPGTGPVVTVHRDWYY